jgi:hypothetical protein
MPAFRVRVVTIALAAVAATSLSSAAVSQAPNRATIAASALVDWGQFGAEFTNVVNVTSFSANAITGAVSGSSTTFSVLTGSTFNADFLATDNVLALFDINIANATAGRFVLTFDTPVFAAGAQVQANTAGSFAGTVAAYNTGGVLLGSFTVNGSNGLNGDGSAAFAGIVSDALDIKRIEFFGFGDGAGINGLSVRNIAQPIPEPSAAAMMLAGLLGVAALSRRRLREKLRS